MPLANDWTERARTALPGELVSPGLSPAQLAEQLETAVAMERVGRRERLSLWIEYVTSHGAEGLRDGAAERALAWSAKALATQHQASDIVPGWDPDLRRLFDALAAAAPELLDEARQHFPPRAVAQMDFALSLTGRGEFPDSELPALARHFVNTPPGTFAYEGRVPSRVLAAGLLQLLRNEAVPLLQWSRVQQLLEHGDDELRSLVLLNYCGQDFRARAFELFDASGAKFLDFLERAYERRELSFSGAIATALVLTRARGERWGEAPPEKVREALLWDLRCGNDVDAALSLEAYRQLTPSAAGGLLRECLREERAIALIPAVEDPGVIRELLARIESSGESSGVAVDALVACGDRALPLLVEACAKKPAAAVGLVAAEVFGRLESPPIASLVALLGHGSKRVVVAASRSLERLGEGAREELEQATQGGKQNVRVQCQRLLAKLGERPNEEDTPLQTLARRASSMPRAAVDAFLASWRAAGDSEAGDSEEVWQSTLRPRVMELGALALELLREWFADTLEEGETRLWCYAVEELRDDPDAVWVAVDTFARMPKLGASLWARPRRALSHCGELLAAPIVFVLRSVQTEYREALFGLLAAQAASVGHDVFLAGLSDPSKVVRTHCVDGLSRVGDGPLLQVAALLAAAEVGTRISAAELLAVWGRREVSDQVVRAWEHERSAKVRPYLEDTLVACGREDVVFSLDERRKLEPDDVERFLETQRLPKKWPPFAQPQDLPVLHFRDGRPLSMRARQGLLARLTMLDLTLKGRTLRSVLPLFNPQDSLVWSRQIYEGWARARNSKHKWAVLQLSLLADDALVADALEQLGRWPGREHTAISCHLRAAQWHGSDTAVHWLGYWSENLPSLGGRATASQLLGRVAFKRGCSVAELRHDMPAFLVEERNEARLSGELGSPYERRNMTAELERSWLSGRTWAASALARLLSEQRYLVGERLLWRAVDGRLCRFVGDPVQGELRTLDDVKIAAAERLRLAHPLDFEPEELQLWRGSSAQASVIDQLERTVYSAVDMPQLLGIEVPAQRFSKWRREQQWFHGEPMDAGIVYTDSLHLLGRNLVATLHHSGYVIGAGEFDDEVRLLGLDFSDLDGQPISAEHVDPVVYSEVHRSITLLRATD